jgi:hypothetical protein
MSINSNINLNTQVLDNNLSETQEQTIENIKKLQNIELDLYKSLETNLNNNILTEQEKENMINKINEVSIIRINLFNSLISTYSFYENNVLTSQTVLNNQITALKLADDELKFLKIRMNEILGENKKNRRLIQINTYYGKQYDAYASVMKYILLFCIPILILSILANKKIIPENIYNGLVIFILVISFIIIIFKLWDISLRDNMNFDEYNWRFTPPKTTNSKVSRTDTTSSTRTTNEEPCVGSLCCSSSQTYNETLNLCVPMPISTTTNNADLVGDSDTPYKSKQLTLSSEYN